MILISQFRRLCLSTGRVVCSRVGVVPHPGISDRSRIRLSFVGIRRCPCPQAGRVAPFVARALARSLYSIQSSKPTILRCSVMPLPSPTRLLPRNPPLSSAKTTPLYTVLDALMGKALL